MTWEEDELMYWAPIVSSVFDAHILTLRDLTMSSGLDGQPLRFGQLVLSITAGDMLIVDTSIHSGFPFRLVVCVIFKSAFHRSAATPQNSPCLVPDIFLLSIWRGMRLTYAIRMLQRLFRRAPFQLRLARVRADKRIQLARMILAKCGYNF